MGKIFDIIGIALVGSALFGFGTALLGHGQEAAYFASKIGFFIFGGYAVVKSIII